MTVSRYLVRGRIFLGGDPQLQSALASVHDSPERPRCLCVSDGVEMYVARHGEFVVKRMPGTGHRHHVSCPSFEPEAGISGLGELWGDAIQEHTPDRIELRTDFPLVRLPAASTTPTTGEAVTGAIAVARRRMSLRAVLHFLFDRAGFNRWYPAMDGRRSQNVISRYLGEAARGVTLKGELLADRLFVPEQFRSADAESIRERRRRRLSFLAEGTAAFQVRLGLLIGQLIGSEPTAHGRRLTVKHMPDAPLHIDGRTWNRIERLYAATLQAADADVEHKPRIVFAALIFARDHVYHVDAMSLMLTGAQWIPLEGLHELPLVEALQRDGRAFLKPLRFDAKGYEIPNVLLLDAGPTPVALHLDDPRASAKEAALKERVIRAAGQSVWHWRPGEEMPPLPVKVGRPDGSSA